MCVCACACHVHVCMSHLHLAPRRLYIKLTPDFCSLSVWLPIIIFPAVFLLHSLCAAKLHCIGTIQWNPSGIFALIVIVCPKSKHIVTKGDKPLCLLCLRLLAGGLGKSSEGQQSAFCFKMSGLRQHKPVLLTFRRVRPDLGQRLGNEGGVRQSSDDINHKSLCHLPSPSSLWPPTLQSPLNTWGFMCLKARKAFFSQPNPFESKVYFFFFAIPACCQIKPWMCQHDILIPQQTATGAGFGVMLTQPWKQESSFF